MEPHFADRAAKMNGTATREILKHLSTPDIVSFAGGLPAAECLPLAAVQTIANEVLAGPEAGKLLQYGTTEGYLPLIEEMKKLVSDFGVPMASNENLLIVSGGQQGIDLMCKSFLNKGDVVLVENPTYLAVLPLIYSYEGIAQGVRSDENGIDIEDLEQKIVAYKPKFIYLVPTFSNPTGKTYSEENRKEICRVTAKYGVPVLEDDPYARLRFSGDKINALASFAEDDNIIYLTSLSKILSPGLRLAAVAGNAKVLRRMAIGKQGTDLHSNLLGQAIAAEYLRRGLLRPALRESLPLYKTRKDAMMKSIKAYMPIEFTHTDPDGGLFIWGEFTGKGEHLDTAALLHGAVERNVAYIQGKEFFADGGGQNTIRLNFSNADPARIDVGMKHLGEYFKEQLAAL